MRIHIEFAIPTETISLENSRFNAGVSKDNLMWCFSGELRISCHDRDEILFETEACVFAFANDLCEAIFELKQMRDGTIGDRYGLFNILCVSEEGSVRAVETSTERQLFKIETGSLVDAARDYCIRLERDTRRIFPFLSGRPAFEELWLDCYSKLDADWFPANASATDN